VGQGLLTVEALRHSDTPHWVGIFWMTEEVDAEISNSQHTTFTTDRLPFPRPYSNPQCQQMSGRRPTYLAWPLGLAFARFTKWMYICIGFEIIKLCLCYQSVFLTHLSIYQTVCMIFTKLSINILPPKVYWSRFFIQQYLHLHGNRANFWGGTVSWFQPTE
jgi:hypothetical protein